MAWNAYLPTSVTEIKATPAQVRDNWEAFEAWTAEQHYGLTSTASAGQHIAGGCSVIAVNVSTAITALSDVVCGFAYATDLVDFGYNDGTGWNRLGGPIASGTRMLFYADTAPSGWTLLTSVNDKVVYITKGSSGVSSVGQSGGQIHTTGSWTITGLSTNVGDHVVTIAEMPAHTHTYTYEWTIATAVAGGFVHPLSDAGDDTNTATAGAGGDAAHNHTMAAHDGLWRPAASCVIICTKD